jgi:hypothetical protein
MPSNRVRPAVLSILVTFLLFFTNSVAASADDAVPPPCNTAAQFDPANFPDPPKIDNQWDPRPPGTQFFWSGEADRGGGLLPHQVVSSVTDVTKMINGVRAVVILEEDIKEGKLQKSELAFHAQDNVGNLWSLGEYSAEYEDGELSEAPDTWISGLDEAVPGNIMLADPQLGTPEYLQAWSPDIELLDCAKVYKMQQETCVPLGCYQNVMITDERNSLDPERGHQRKYYAPGVGNVRVGFVDDSEGEALVLVGINQLSPDELAKARQDALKLEKHAYEISDLYRQTSPIEVPPDMTG